MKRISRKVCILGSGFAGLNSQLFLQRAGVENVLITGMSIGGQIMYTSDISNYLPNYRMSGPEMIRLSREQLKAHDCESIVDMCVEIQQLTDVKLEVICKRHIIECSYVIVATGANWRMLGLKNEEIAIDKTIFTCVSCESDRIRDKTVAIIGGGEKAVNDALYCARICNKVYLIVRKERFRYCGPLIEKIEKNEKIEVYFRSQLVEINEDLTFLFCINEENRDLKVDFCVLSIGHTPNTNKIKGLPNLDEDGFIVTDRFHRTSHPRIYAAGEVQDNRYKQLVTSASDGAKCAMEIIRNLMYE